jgi:hypothetical protein
MTTPDHRADTDVAACVITLSDLPDTPPCCARAHERGYRRGYRDGYWYALWDLGEVLRLPAGLWPRCERFYYEVLSPWVWRAPRGEAPVIREGGPRLAWRRRRTRKET